MNKYPQITNPETGEVDCLVTHIAGLMIEERERDKEEMEAMKRQHK